MRTKLIPLALGIGGIGGIGAIAAPALAADRPLALQLAYSLAPAGDRVRAPRPGPALPLTPPHATALAPL